MADFRQFFFDDGKSRKRWQVCRKGKTQTVRFGRLTGKLRESSKTFASTADAREDVEKLILKKLRDGYMEIDPTRLKFVRPRGLQPATTGQVRQLEKKLGVKLPEEYREFLLKSNGGHANPGYVKIAAGDQMQNVHAGGIFHLRPSKFVIEELNYEMDRNASLLADGYLPIARGEGLVTISLKPTTFGAIHWWVPGSTEYLLAGSFREFLTRLACVFDDRSAAAPKQEARRAASKEAAPKKTAGKKAAAKKAARKNAAPKKSVRKKRG